MMQHIQDAQNTRITHSKKVTQKLKFCIAINLTFTIFEYAFGILTGSLALMSDAAHNLTDATSLIIAFFAQRLALRKSCDKKTYGWGRATILAALINATLLLVIALYIFKEAYERFYHPQQIEGTIVMVVAFFGILINAGAALMFYKDRADLSIKSAFANMIFDAIASAGALLSGLIIVVTGQSVIDPLIGVIIGIMLLISAVRILREVVHILFEGVPSHLSVKTITKHILEIPHVVALDDLHIWAVSSQDAALSCHIIIDSKNLTHAPAIIQDIKSMLEKDFNIYHSTIEAKLAKNTNNICSIF